MNILKAAERISKNHLGDVSTFTLKFIRDNGEWRSVDHDYKWNHGFTQSCISAIYVPIIAVCGIADSVSMPLSREGHNCHS